MKKQMFFFPPKIWITQKNKNKILTLFGFASLVFLAKLNNWMNGWCTDPPASTPTLHPRRWTQRRPSLWMRKKAVLRNKHLHNIALYMCIITYSYVYFVPAALNFVFIFMFYDLLGMWMGCVRAHVTVWNVLGNDSRLHWVRSERGRTAGIERHADCVIQKDVVQITKTTSLRRRYCSQLVE